MKRGRQVAGGFQVLDALGDPSRSRSFLADEPGRRGRPRWVLKWLGPPDGDMERGEPLSGVFRPDIAGLSCLSHPAIAVPTAFGRDRATGRAFLLRPYVPGAEIASAARGRRLKDLLPWLVAAAGALDLLHRSGFLHRNLKASNLIVARNALLSRPRRECMVVLGDAAWWPGDPPATAADDLHSLGQIFYRLIAGKEVEPAKRGFPAPPSSLNPEVGLDLERLILKLLHPDPRRRYQETGPLLEDLRRFAGGRTLPVEGMPERFLDRHAELKEVQARLAALRPAAISVTGESGMGKTAFLRRLSVEGQLRGYRTAFIRCFPGPGAPGEPLRQLAEAILTGHPSLRSVRSAWRKLPGGNGPEDCAPAAGEPNTFHKALLDSFLEGARGQPCLLLVDDVHHADPLTIGFLARLIREVPGALPGPVGERPLISLAVSYRSEAPFRPTLGPLLAACGSAGEGGLTLELGPFSRQTVEEALLQSGFAAGAERNRIIARLKGHPLLLRETVRTRDLRRGESPLVERDLDSLHERYLASLAIEGRSAVEALAVLGRPAPVELLSQILVLPRRKLQPPLEALLGDGALGREVGRVFFQHGSFRAWILERIGRERRKKLHGTIASILESRGETAEEIAEHWLRSDRPARGVPAALAAARRLARHHQNRRALEFYQAVLDHQPRSKRLEESCGAERAIAEEAAAAFSRAGEHRRAAEVMLALLPGCRRPREAGRLHGRVGIFCHRGGDVPGAVDHLRKGLRLLDGAPGLEWVRERVRFQSELAEIASTSGDYSRSETLCREALRSLGRSGRARQDREIRRGEMQLLETMAHLRLRRFQYREARLFFEKSLRAGKPLGATSERGLLLNNLGTLHAQENRFQKAIDCYRQAQQVSERLGDDQSLAIIHSNLAVLHARVGEPEAADAALAQAGEHDARCDSRRSRFLRIHSAGLVDLSFGRYGSAIEAFRSAIRLGEAQQDLHLVAFELVFLGECHLFQGEARAAGAALERAAGLGTTAPRPILSMVEARRAALAALRGDCRKARSFLSARSSGVPYVDAGNRVFRGWAHRLCARGEPARAELEEARAFFARVRVPGGEIHASLELAALEGENGRPAAALDRMRELQERFACGKGPLRNAMLSARLLAYHTRLLAESDPPRLEEAEALLVEAESYLIGRRLPDLEELTARLRERIRRAGAVEVRPSAENAAGGRPPLSAGEEVFGANRLLGRSASLRNLVGLVLQVAPSRLPVLITGETGTGKELVARAIHGESPRRLAPFVAVNCAALPAELLEAQLFGYRRGAFSGAEEDHPGLLSRAAGGTFFFDEIAELPLQLQAKLLRVLDGGKVRPLGGESEIEIEVRFVFATNRDLRPLAEKGSFRRDLFFRLSAFEITVPPLRERTEDLPLLAEHFRRQAGGDALELGQDALDALASHSWPGNVRELKNLITRLVLTAPGPVGAAAVRPLLRSAPPAARLFSPSILRSQPLETLHSRLESEYLIQLHADRDGDLKAMAASLGISVRAVYERFRRLGITLRDLR